MSIVSSNHNGTALDFAIKKGFLEIIELLEAAGIRNRHFDRYYEKLYPLSNVTTVLLACALLRLKPQIQLQEQEGSQLWTNFTVMCSCRCQESG